MRHTAQTRLGSLSMILGLCVACNGEVQSPGEETGASGGSESSINHGGASSSSLGGSVSVGGATSGGTGGGTGADGSGVGGATSGGATSGGAAGSSDVTISAAGAPQMSATGVAVLTVPLATYDVGQRFLYENYDGKAPYDLSRATLNILASAPGATAGNLHVFFTSFGRNDSSAFDIPLSSITNGFTTISIPVPPASGSYDPALLIVVRIDVEAGSAVVTGWQTPATVVYIDRIWTSNGLYDDNFVASIDPVVLALSGARTTPTASTLTWVSQVNLGAGSGGGAAGAGQAGNAGWAGGAAGSAGRAGGG